MIAIVLSLFLGMLAYVFSGLDNTSMWICIGLIGLVWFARMVWVDEDRAWLNWQDFWLTGKTDWMRKKERVKYKQGGEMPLKMKDGKTTFTCESCGNSVEVAGRRYRVNGRLMMELVCPVCGSRYSGVLNEGK